MVEVKVCTHWKKSRIFSRKWKKNDIYTFFSQAKDESNDHNTNDQVFLFRWGALAWFGHGWFKSSSFHWCEHKRAVPENGSPVYLKKVVSGMIPAYLGTEQMGFKRNHRAWVRINSVRDHRAQTRKRAAVVFDQPSRLNKNTAGHKCWWQMVDVCISTLKADLHGTDA